MLEAVGSLLQTTTALPDSPTPLLNNQTLDPLTAIVSGTAGTWHPGHALYCLWRWARRRRAHTRVRSATWRFYLDGRQQLEAIPQRERTAETPTAPNLCPVFATHQIRALALGEQLQPTIHTETEAEAAHPCARNLQCPPQRPCATRGKPPRAMSRSRPPDLQRRRTATHARRESRTGHTQGRRRQGGRRIPSSRRRTRRWRSHERLRNQLSAATTPGEPTLPKRTPSYHPTKRGRATHSNNACRSGIPAGKTSTCPARATDTQRIEGSLSSPWCRTRETTQRLPPTSPGRGPRFPDPRNPPATEKGAAPNSDLSFHLTLLSREPDPHGAGPRGQPNTQDPQKNSSRMLPSKARIKGYVHRGDPRAPPPVKLNALDAGGDSAHTTCENGTWDALPAES